MNTLSAERLIRRIERIPHKEFVLHGSTRRRRLLIPRKPTLTTNNKELRRRAIYATSFVHIAILYAVVADDPRWKCSLKKSMRVLVPKDGLPVVSGYVHVCDRSLFTKNPYVSAATRPIRVKSVIKIDYRVLKHLLDKGEIQLVDKF